MHKNVEIISQTSTQIIHQYLAGIFIKCLLLPNTSHKHEGQNKGLQPTNQYNLPFNIEVYIYIYTCQKFLTNQHPSMGCHDWLTSDWFSSKKSSGLAIFSSKCSKTSQRVAGFFVSNPGENCLHRISVRSVYAKKNPRFLRHNLWLLATMFMQNEHWLSCVATSGLWIIFS